MFGKKEGALCSVAVIISGVFNFAALNSDAAPFAWNNVSSMPISRVEAASAIISGKLYIFGGFINNSLQATNRVDVYDPVGNTWTRLADMPIAVTHVTAAVDGDTVWFAGGFAGNNPGAATNAVRKYNVVSNVWSAGPSLPESRGSGALVRMGRKLHFLGGYMPDRQTDSTNHWVLSMDGGTNWIRAAALQEARGHLSAVVLRGKIYAIGGQHGHDATTSDVRRVDVYDPGANTWTRAADLPFSRSHCEAATFVLNDRIILVGGKSSSLGQGALSSVVEYNPDANQWVGLLSLPANLVACSAQAIGCKIIVAGGGQGSLTSPVNETRIGMFEDKWEVGPSMPLDMSEVACGIIGNKLYIVGDGTDYTAILDLPTMTWSVSYVVRPFPYHHHAAEVYNGKLYLFGSLDDNGFGKMQIYDPVADSWSVGPTAPFLSGSCCSTLINGEMYVSGGCVNWIIATSEHAKYNPINNIWTSLAPMPRATHHTACGTDGEKFYCFGGRQGAGGVVENGHNTVQIYNPKTDSWVSSDDPASGIPPLPQGRPGMTKAPYYNGEFYIIGGETLSGAGATTNHVYDRVDIYNPRTKTWRLGTPMPTARHGIFPFGAFDRIFVISGSLHSAYGLSSIMEIYHPLQLGPFRNDFEWANGLARLRFPTASGKTYRVQRRSDFGASWTVLTNVPGNGGTMEIITSGSASREFYRVERLP